MAKPNCHQCKHFLITYDARHPYGCRLYSLKGKDLPSTIVRMAGSGDCQGFAPKPARKPLNEKTSVGDLERG